MNRENINIGGLLAQAMTSIRTKEYRSAVEPLLELRRFCILNPLQVTDGEKLAMQNMEDSLTAALSCIACGQVSKCASVNVLACYQERVKR